MLKIKKKTKKQKKERKEIIIISERMPGGESNPGPRATGTYNELT